MVAISKVSSLWPTKGRSTRRSVTTPTTTISATVTGRASQKFRPSSIKPTKDKTAKNTIAPWAKLNTPEAL